MIWFSWIGIFLQVQRQEQLRIENWNTKALFMFIQRQLSTPVQIFSGDSGWQSLSALNPRDQGWRCCRVLSDVSFAWHNRLPRAVAVCCPLSVVRCPRCPLSAVRCRLSDKHQQYTSEHLFPKVSENNLVSHFRQLHNVCTAQDIVLFWHTPHTVIRCTPYGKRLYDYLFDSSGPDVSPIYTILYMFYDAAAYNACCWCWCCFVATATDELWAQLSQLRYNIKTITHCIISATRKEKQKQKQTQKQKSKATATCLASRLRQGFSRYL